MAADLPNQFDDARIVLAALRQGDHGFGHNIGNAADRAGSARRTGAAEISLVADKDLDIGKG